MKARKDELLTVILFCGFLAVMLVLYLVLPKRDFSDREKRYLESAPELNMEALASGQWGADVESYMADHIPGRDFFVGLNSTFDLITGRQITKDVRLLESGRLVEKPVQWRASAVEKNMRAINAFADTVKQRVDLMIVPSAGWAAEEESFTGLDLFSREEYQDETIIADIGKLAQENVHAVDILDVLRGQENYYFRTDHHWTSEGAYEVYASYMTKLSRDYPGREAFTVETVEGFYGSNHSRSALWAIPAEPLELWHSESVLMVSNGETDGVHDGVFYRERLEEVDKYTVYLDGNHSVVRIENPANAGKGKILVIRDSYSNVFGTFLAESYETVVLVDLRYYKNPVSEMLAEEAFDDILVCYSIGNFMTDANIIWLR